MTNPHIQGSQINKQSSDKQRIFELEEALKEIKRLSCELAYQNIGMWPATRCGKRSENIINKINKIAAKVTKL